jgi:hypothetical protein
MARKTIRLKHEEEDYFLLALACHEADYRTCWILNQSLGLKLVRMENLPVHDQKTGSDLEFARYFFDDEERMAQWYLISNHTENAFFAPEHKNIDFFLRLSGEISEKDIKNILADLKKTSGILTAFQTDRKTIRNQAFLQF